MQRHTDHRPGPGGVLGNQRGIALVLVLLVIALLTTLIIEFDFRTRLDLRAAGAFRDDASAYLLADSAAQVARAVLYEDRINSGYDGFDEDWAKPFVDVPVGNGTVTVVATDEDGKFDLNILKRPADGASEQESKRDEQHIAIFDRLLVDVLEVEPERAVTMRDSLIDWIDADDGEEPDGAEASYYQSLEQPYGCRNGPLRTVDELGLVKGFDREMIEKLSPHVTVMWEGSAPPAAGAGKVNINTVTAELLRALSPEITEEIAGNIIAGRPFSEPADITAAGLQGKVQALGEDAAQEIVPLLRRDSDHFSVEARGVVGDTVRTVRALLSRKVAAAGEQRVRVIAWRVE
ncbi:MAG: type II secretion system minor pseudopilin GspK [Nitrospirae bacterium]|nr:type II secretion system minor pseudopilin GspK [Nitrospirota bacterium]